MAHKPRMNKDIADKMIGATIVDVKLVDTTDWLLLSERPLVVIDLSNGMSLHFQSDDEFNDTGIAVLNEIVEDESQEEDKVSKYFLNYCDTNSTVGIDIPDDPNAETTNFENIFSADS
jgi:hypothetical protein